MGTFHREKMEKTFPFTKKIYQGQTAIRKTFRQGKSTQIKGRG